MDFGKTRSIRCISFPALPHEIVDLPGTGRRSCQIPLAAVVLIPVIAVLYHLFTRQFSIRLLHAQHQYLPQGHRERPYITFSRLFTLWNKKVCINLRTFFLAITAYVVTINENNQHLTNNKLSHDIQRIGSLAFVSLT